MRFYGAIFLMSCFCGSAWAGNPGPDSVQVLLGSSHINVSAPRAVGQFEEVNPGIILVWRDEVPAINLAAGVFRNSYGKLAPVGAVSIDRPINDDLGVAAFVGAAFYGDDARFVGEKYSSAGFVPYAGVQVNYKNVFVQAAPLTQESGELGVVLGFGLSFDLD